VPGSSSTPRTAPHDVLLGRLGDDVLGVHGRDWHTFPTADPRTPNYFAEVDTYDKPDANPVWSPDGQRLIFLGRERGPYDDDIIVMNADGSGQTRVAAGLTGRPAVWSSDGQRIAFAQDTRAGWYVCVVNADGTQLRRLAEGTHPMWLPTNARRS
jgi:Tol biopolymer transport system component